MSHERVARALAGLSFSVLLTLMGASCGGGAKKAAPDGGQAPSCQNSLDCPSSMVCDRSIAQCVGCVTASDCPDNNDCTARQCVPFVPCANSLDCPKDQVCDTTAGRCVACLADADCADPKQTCVANTCRTKCASDRTCTPLGLLCDLSTGSCVRCVTGADCPAGQYCQANECVKSVCVANQTTCMLNAVATCDSMGGGFVGTAVPCDPQICVTGASGARCADAPPDGGAGGTSGTGGTGGSASGGTTGAGGGSTAGTTGAGGGGPGGTTGAGGSAGSSGAAGSMAGTTGSAGEGGRGGTTGAAGSTGAAGTTGAGGTTGSGGTGGGTAGTCGNTIDDMEANTGMICRGNGRHGHWYTYNDKLAGTTQTPTPGVAPIFPDAVVPPRGTSTLAMHTSGTFHGYGAIGCSLNGTDMNVPEMVMPYSVAGFTGISFYAKGTPSSIQVIIQTRGTLGTDFGGTCTGTCAANRTTISLNSTNWTFYTLPFSMFINGTVSFTPADALTIEFQAYGTSGVEFTGNFWIDDLSFY